LAGRTPLRLVLTLILLGDNYALTFMAPPSTDIPVGEQTFAPPYVEKASASALSVSRLCRSNAPVANSGFKAGTLNRQRNK
jgi:hypothetical protein